MNKKEEVRQNNQDDQSDGIPTELEEVIEKCGQALEEHHRERRERERKEKERKEGDAKD